MAEELIRIPTSNYKYIYGVYSKVDQSKWLIIFIHGLTASQNEPMIAHGQTYFNAKWYSTFRFDLYGNRPDARKLISTNLKDHITDVNKVIAHFLAQWVEKIILMGHSLGGLTILYSDLTHVSSVVLRDASIGGEELLNDVDYSEVSDTYFINWWDGMIFPIGKSMYEDFSIPPAVHLEQIQKIHLPIAMIWTEYGLRKAAKSYYDVANEPKKLHIVQSASHCFPEPGAEKELYEVSLEWIERV